MPRDDDDSPIDDTELLYRRIPVAREFYNAQTGWLSEEAFHPSRHDESGISLSRAEFYESASAAASGRNPKGYFLAPILASDARNAGAIIEPVPDPDVPGHCEFSNMRYENRHDDDVKQMEIDLAQFCRGKVQGPYHVQKK